MEVGWECLMLLELGWILKILDSWKFSEGAPFRRPRPAVSHWQWCCLQSVESADGVMVMMMMAVSFDLQSLPADRRAI